MSKELAIQTASVTDIVDFEKLTAEQQALYTGQQDNDFKASDIKYGWLGVAQSLTPKALKSKEEYVPGLEPGMFYHSLDNTVYGKSITVCYQKYFPSYTLNEPDGKKKFISNITEHDFESQKASGEIVFKKKGVDGWKQSSGFYHVPTSNLVKKTWNFMVALPDHPEAGVLRLGLSVGGYKHIMNWISMINNTYVAPGKKANKYAVEWELTLVAETNTDGDNWFTIGSGSTTTVKKLRMTRPEFIAQAKAGYDFFQGVSVAEVTAKDKGDDDIKIDDDGVPF